MTDQHPFDPLDDLASAHLDGASTPEEAARVDVDPEIQARIVAMGRIREVMATPPPHPREARERAINAALAAYDEEANPAIAVTPVTSRAWGRTPIVWRVVGVAAAVALVVALVPMVASFLPSASDGSQTAAPQLTSPPTTGRALSESAPGSSPATNNGAGSSAIPPSPVTTVPAVDALPPTATTIFDIADLGTFPNDAAVVDAVRTLPLQSRSVPSYASLPDPTSCIDELLNGLPPGSVAQLAANATVAEQEVGVVARAEDVRIAGGDCTNVRVLTR